MNRLLEETIVVTFTMFVGIVLTFLRRMFLVAKYPAILSFNVQSVESIMKYNEETGFVLLITIKLQMYSGIQIRVDVNTELQIT
jgi:hypothetical protein